MKKNYKKVYGYGIIFLVCVIAVVFVGILSQQKTQVKEADYQNLITANQNSIRILEEENAQLKKKISELEKKLSEEKLFVSDVTTSSQAINDMKEIFDTFRAGEKSRAKTDFQKIEPIGFDDNALLYYEILKELLEK
ncbi:MAG: hypothetical protein IJW15_00440 [Clostridia bacterium]|nr:hypothetical protein [Clostridia bacterium]